MNEINEFNQRIECCVKDCIHCIDGCRCNLNDEKSLREVISTLSALTGKDVSKEKENKIVDTILKGKVPKSVDKMF